MRSMCMLVGLLPTSLWASNSGEPQDTFALIIFIVVVVGVWLVVRGFKSRCRSCGRWFAMTKYDEDLVGQRRMKARTPDMQKIKATFKIYRECKHCGCQDAITKTKTLY